MGGVTYDSGGLIAAERDDPAVWALHRRTLERGLAPTVPAGVLAQAWRDPRQARLSRLLSGCNVEDLSAARARASGLACGAADASDVIDASVVVGAASRRDLVLTSDAGDLARLRDALGLSLELRQV